MPPQPSIERRHTEREKYLVLRLYARVLSVISYVVLVGMELFAVLVIPLANAPIPERVSIAFTSAIMGGVYFVILRATAQAIYLLFDVARNSKTTRELLEKTSAAAAPTSQPRPAPGD